jgi:hypothetical protein
VMSTVDMRYLVDNFLNSLPKNVSISNRLEFVRSNRLSNSSSSGRNAGSNLHNCGLVLLFPFNVIARFEVYTTPLARGRG